MDEETWRAVQRDLVRAAAVHAPEWVDQHDSDPGITLLQLLAFLTEPLLQRVRPSDRSRALAGRIAEAHARFRDGADSAHGTGPTRLRYFEGRLLTADDYRTEQTYFLEKHRRHLQALHGSGVVAGLHVEASTSGDRITLSAGIAIDGDGREIVVPADAAFTIDTETDDSPAVFVVIEYLERCVAPMPSPFGSGEEAGRIEEGYRVRFLASAGSAGVPIACLVRTGSGWQTDVSYVPPRVR